ncbi:MAG: hypothetical protein JST22_06985 [Bacteroidetes bacterium]|nr:hypothetical protein [Bacteroidota bacterium]
MIQRIVHAVLLFGLAAVIVSCGDKTKGKAPDASTDKKTGASAATDVASSGGTEFTSKEGKFTVKYPDGFTMSSNSESTMPLETAVGKLDMKVNTAMKGAGEVMMTAYIDYPDKAFDAGIPVMLDGAQDGAMKNLGGTVEHREDITLDGNPGRSLTFSGKSSGTDVYGRVDYYIVKPRLYQILYLSDKKDGVSSDPVKAAFSSFKLNK